MVRANDEWFSGGGDTPLCIPVKIGQPEPGFTLVSSTLPTLMKPGATYNVTLGVRNDGPAAWKAGWKLMCGESAAASQTDVEPGRIAEVTLPVVAANDTNLLRWEVFDGEKSLPASGATESVKITATDYGPRFLTSDTPEEMNAGKRTHVNLTLSNTGVETCTKADYTVGYHWYTLDGAELQWDGEKVRLPADVRPGEQVAVKAPVTPPKHDGQYYLVWDLAHGDKWASTTANTRGADILLAPVKVVKGDLVTVDLTKLFDADVISFGTNPKDGDAGGGFTLPAEFLPPQVSRTPRDGKLWPEGLWAATNGRDQATRVSFLYPSKLDGDKNAVTCSGQTIDVKAGKYSAVHFLILATEKTVGEFGYALKDSAPAKGGFGMTPQFSPWTEPPLPLAEQRTDIGFMCPRRHSADGDQPNQPCYLTHYTAPGLPLQEGTGIILPNNPALKVMAITLEKAP